MARRYHALTTRYNIKFNGEESYKDGLEQLRQAHKEDYSVLLPIYPISNHKIAASGSGKMNTCIQKCETAIKTHSIRVKPDKKPPKNASEKEKLFYEQEEFNPLMGSVFLLMAQAQFHKADFESAVATCSYIQRHFSHDKPLCDEAGILMARAYYEEEWFYEAENIFVQMNESGFDPKLNGAFSIAYADFLLRKGEYRQAVPLLEIGLNHTPKRYDKQRYTFLLAQLYQDLGEKEKAYKLYKAIPRSNPPYEMDLNARIRQTEVYSESHTKTALKKLRKMERNPNNTNYLDAIYYAMGNCCLSAQDTLGAIENYQKAVQKSHQNGPYKMQALLAMGNYYYEKEDFLSAEPCFNQAASMIKADHKEKDIVAEKARVLGLLYPHLENIHVQDSLQQLADMPEAERNAIIDHQISEYKKRAKEEARQKAREEALSANEQLTQEANADKEANAPNMALANNDQSWYFYNDALKANGKKTFERTWGRRKLEDNWRIKNKEDLSALFQEGNAETPTMAESTNQLPLSSENPQVETTETTASREEIQFEASDDPSQVGYYLKDLPFTEEQREASDALICEALFQSGMIYREEMENDALAMRSFDLLEKRFPEDTLFRPEVYYISYLMRMQQGKIAEAETGRQKLLSDFPESEQAKTLSDEHFLANLSKMYQSQDSLYDATYLHFINNHSDTVLHNCMVVEEKYPRSYLRPKFLFLQALEAVKAGDPEDFLSCITLLAKKYPESDLAPISTQMLQYWDEGRRPVRFDGLFTGLANEDSIAQALRDSIAEKFTYQAQETHVFAFGFSPDSINANRLLFDVALYNFTQFLVRDYELSIEKIGSQDVLMVYRFEDAEDALRYASWINFQGEAPKDKYPGLKLFIFSESNLNLLRNDFPEEIYREFFERNYPQP